MAAAAVASRQADLPSTSQPTDFLAEEYLYFLEFAATVIQRHFRGYLVRRDFYRQLQARNNAAAAQADSQAVQLRQDAAARCIQRAWQSFRNRRIYQYYRDLIQFRERGDPREMLRAINPREAQLADAASGIHVRFRLGGTMFPPLVFYKIFTHRSVTDINAFGPRNYAAEVSVSARHVHNKAKEVDTPGLAGTLLLPAGPGMAVACALRPTRPTPGALVTGAGGASAMGRSAAASGALGAGPLRSTAASGGGASQRGRREFGPDFEVEEALREYIRPDGTIGYRSTMGWYERVDNNGWRPIAERVLLDEDPITTMTRLRRQPFFHYSPAVRREEKLRRAKQRKREWLLKMYRAQGTGGKVGDQLPQLPGSSLEDLDDADLDNLQVDELLEWSQHLDFSAYVDDWTSLACTLGTEAWIPEVEGPPLSGLPPPSVDVRGAMVAAGVPLQPFRGGVGPACGATSDGLLHVA